VTSERIIMIPGMGADERLFDPQSDGGLRFEAVRFPIPQRGDDLPAYARRLVDEWRVDSSCVLVGVSFGGMVACELARICRPRCVLLIASCCNREALPRYYSLVEWFSRIVPDWLVRRRAAASSRILTRLESLNPEQAQLIREMSMDVPIEFLRCAGRMIVRWKPPGPLPCPLYHIHGALDRIIPITRVQAGEVIADGGHLINLTHAPRVNAFIRRHVLCGERPERMRVGA
jgi:pimeloyl-ACP methyl ester carboxylesterase